MLCNMLQANDIEAHSRGAKEYGSHITGSDQGHYEIVVPEKDIQRAQELIQGVEEQSVQQEKAPIPSSRYLQSALIFAVGALFLYPFIFNAVSFFSLGGYWKREKSLNAKVAWSILVLAINIFAASMYLDLWYLSF